MTDYQLDRLSVGKTPSKARRTCHTHLYIEYIILFENTLLLNYYHLSFAQSLLSIDSQNINTYICTKKSDHILVV